MRHLVSPERGPGLKTFCVARQSLYPSQCEVKCVLRRPLALNGSLALTRVHVTAGIVTDKSSDRKHSKSHSSQITLHYYALGRVWRRRSKLRSPFGQRSCFRDRGLWSRSFVVLAHNEDSGVVTLAMHSSPCPNSSHPARKSAVIVVGTWQRPFRLSGTILRHKLIAVACHTHQCILSKQR